MNHFLFYWGTVYDSVRSPQHMQILEKKVWTYAVRYAQYFPYSRKNIKITGKWDSVVHN